MVLPVKVIGAGDGQWDANAWKTGAFYGNPLDGFVLLRSLKKAKSAAEATE